MATPNSTNCATRRPNLLTDKSAGIAPGAGISTGGPAEAAHYARAAAVRAALRARRCAADPPGRGMSTGPCYHSRMNAICRVACLLGLTALMSPLPAPAQQSGATRYAVEIIVFRDASVGANEDWTAAPQGRGFGNESTPA